MPFCGVCTGRSDKQEVVHVERATLVEELKQPDALGISILPGQPRIARNQDLPVMITVHTPKGQSRTPSDVCCVLDISGSMSLEASIVGPAGTSECYGLSLLDVAKHGVRTTINMLTELDRFALVVFDHEATTILGLTTMDKAGRELAEEKLSAVHGKGGTNIWKGLHEGLEALRVSGPRGGNLAHLILLTDGESMDNEEIMPKLEGYKKQHEQMPATINTFGFGSAIDSRLLANLAAVGDGTYSFIPDAGFVGTAFVNTLSNLLVTFAKGVYLLLEPEGGAEIKEVLGNFILDHQQWGCRIKIGTLQYGQPRNVLVVLSTKADKPYLTASAQYQLPGNEQTLLIDAVEGESIYNHREVDVHKCRYNLVDTLSTVVDMVVVSGCVTTSPSIRMRSQTTGADLTLEGNPSNRSIGRSDSNATIPPKVPSIRSVGRSPLPKTESGGSWKGGKVGKLQKVKEMISTPSTMSGEKSMRSTASGIEAEAQALLRKGREEMNILVNSIKMSEVAQDERVAALLEDVVGQASLALTSSSYYWRWGRHYLPSLMFAHQAQQCNNFKDAGVQRYGGELFQQLREQAEDIFDKLAAPKPLPISMAVYNNRNAGCIEGESLAKLASGEEIFVKDLRKGHRVLGPAGKVAEVLCIVRMRCPGGRCALAQLSGGLRLTPYHPILLNGEWVFPADVSCVQDLPCEAVYNLVLSGAPALNVGGVPCAGLGHGVEEGAARHAYYGSRRAVQEVLQRAGAKAGFVELRPEDVLRDPATGLVCGLQPR